MNRKEAIKFILENANEEIQSELRSFKDVYECNKEELNEWGEFRDTVDFFEFVLDEYGYMKPKDKRNLKELMIGLGICEELTEDQLRTMVVSPGGKKYDFILKGKKYDCNSICAMDFYQEEPLKED